MFKSIKLSLLIFCLVACQQQQKPGSKTIENTDWQLITEQSTLSFLSTKNKVAVEEHSIQFKSGQISKQKLDLLLDLNSVDTLIPIRDERLRSILFETETYPTASISQQLPNQWLMDQPYTVSFQLDLHGHQKTFNTQVIIQEVKGQMVVVNFEPIMINAKDFNMDDAINQLTKIAGLQSINYEVLVDFKLTFEKSSI